MYNRLSNIFYSIKCFLTKKYLKNTHFMQKIKEGHISIAFVCMVLGFMLALQFRATLEQKESLPFKRVEELSTRLLETEKERDILKEKITELEKMELVAEKDSVVEDLRLRSGIVTVYGAGVIVRIDDSKLTSKAGENQNLYIIHDEDLLKVVNELRAAGAEAISLNGQRLVSTSEIRCAGPTLSVNNVRSAPPYEIKAIGDKSTLSSALKMRGGIAEALKVWGIQLEIRELDDIEIPAYKGTMQFQYATTEKKDKREDEEKVEAEG